MTQTQQDNNNTPNGSPLDGLFNFDDAFNALSGLVDIFGCINTSNSPKKAKKEIETDSVWLLNRSQLNSGSITIEKINKFLEDINCYKHARYIGSNNFELAKCTRDGNMTGYKLISEYKEQVLQDLNNRLATQGKKIQLSEPFTENHGLPATPSGYHNEGMWYTGFQNEKATFISVPKTPAGGNGGSSGIGLDDDPIFFLSNAKLLFAIILGVPLANIIKNYKNKKPLFKNLFSIDAKN